MKNKIFEGVRFGEKQINDILSRANDFNVGIEYELRIDDYNLSNDLTSHLRNADLMREVNGIVPEHDSMTEIITKKMDLMSALNHIKGMFKFIVDNDIEVPSMAGMHISISTNKYNLEDFNIVKFLILMNSTYLTSSFPERKHVLDIDPIINSVLRDHEIPSDNVKLKDLQKIESTIIEYTDKKYQTINVGQYEISEGRIELRFFGGENYHHRYDEIKVHLLRALLLMEIGYTDLYQKEYYKLLYKRLVADKLSLHDIIPKDEYRDIIKAINSNNDMEIFKSVIKATVDNIKYSPKTAFNILPERIKDRYLKAVSNDHRFAIIHAKRILNGRFPMGEDVIAKDAFASVNYAEHIDDRFKKGEKEIIHNKSTAPRYIFWLSAERHADAYDLIKLMTEMSHDELVHLFEESLSDTYSFHISFNDLHSYIVKSGDREIAQAYIKAMMNINNVTSLTYMFFLINDYQDEYNDKSGNLLSIEQSLEIIDKLDGIPKVKTGRTSRSTLLKEILQTLPDDKVIELLPLYKQYLVSEGKWSDTEHNDIHTTIKRSLMIRFGDRSEEVISLIKKLFP